MAMHPWVTNVVMPIFALTNAGVRRGTDRSTGGGLVIVGTAVALVAGKPLGVVGELGHGAGWAGAPCSGRFVGGLPVGMVAASVLPCRSSSQCSPSPVKSC